MDPESGEADQSGPQNQPQEPVPAERVKNLSISEDGSVTKSMRTNPTVGTISETSSLKVSNLRFLDTDEGFQCSHGKSQRKDETMRLYNAMPSGLAFFLSNGPPRRVQDYKDYEELCRQHKRLKAELELQREPIKERYRTLALKKLALKTSIQTFDHFVQDMERKDAKARSQFLKHRQERHLLNLQIPDLQNQLEDLKKTRDVLEKRSGRTQKLTSFVSNVLKAFENHYKSFHDVIERYETLSGTLKLQKERFQENMELLESVRDLFDSYVESSHQNVLQLRNTIIDLNNARDEATQRNRELQYSFAEHQDRLRDKKALYFIMTSSITNMVQTLLNFRMFTMGRMYNKTSYEAQVEAIGDIIKDYEVILAPLHGLEGQAEHVTSPVSSMTSVRSWASGMR